MRKINTKVKWAIAGLFMFSLVLMSHAYAVVDRRDASDLGRKFDNFVVGGGAPGRVGEAVVAVFSEQEGKNDADFMADPDKTIVEYPEGEFDQGEAEAIEEDAIVSGTPEYAPGQLIVKLNEDATVEDIYDLNQEYNVISINKVFKSTPQAQETLIAVKEQLSGLEAKTHKGWYWQMDKDSEEYKEYLARIEKEKEELEAKIEDAEELVLRIKKRGDRAPEDASLPNLDNIYLLAIEGESSVLAMAGEYSDNPAVEYAQPNYLNVLNMIPDDPFYSSSGSWGQSYDDLWGLKTIEAEEAWDKSQGEGVVVAVIDTGVDYNHEDISDNIYRDAAGQIIGYDFSDGDSDPADYYGHGTHCAGTIAAVGNNSLGVIGVAPRAKIMPVKIFPNAYDSVCANGIKYAVDNGADVLSNSWGPRYRRPSNPLIEDIIDYAYAQGCVVVFAAGNNNDDTAFYAPANHPKVISVAASDENDNKCYFSNWGNVIDVAAPGGGNDKSDPYNVLSLSAADSTLSKSNYLIDAPNTDDDYLRLGGTSMACPHVAGLSALIISYNEQTRARTLSNEQVRQIIRLSADSISDPLGDGGSWGSPNQIFGAGRIDAKKALIASDSVFITTAVINSPLGFSNVAGEDTIKIEGVVTGENITQDQVVLEYVYHNDLQYSSPASSPLAWQSVSNILFDPATGDVSGSIDISGMSQGWISLRLKADTSLGVANDMILVKIDWLGKFIIIEPDFDKYGYKEDFLLGEKGPLVISFQVPQVDYAGLGLDVTLSVSVARQPWVSRSPEIEIGSVVNPPAGVCSINFDSFNFQDGLYDIIFTKEATINGATSTVIDNFLYLSEGYYHVNNTYINTPRYGAIYNSVCPGEIEIKGFSVMPIKRLEAGVGVKPASWQALSFSTAGADEFSASLNPADFDLSGENLITVRVINDAAGQEIENERTAIIVDDTITSGWPKLSQGYESGFKFMLGDVDGEKDDIILVTDTASYVWTQKDYYDGDIMDTKSRCYLYNGEGILNQVCLENSEKLMGQYMQEATGYLKQYVFNAGLAELDDNPGKEIVAIMSKVSGADFWKRKYEVLALTSEGKYPLGWERVVDSDLSMSLFREWESAMQTKTVNRKYSLIEISPVKNRLFR